jgi:hypothetical protein
MPQRRGREFPTKAMRWGWLTFGPRGLSGHDAATAFCQAECERKPGTTAVGPGMAMNGFGALLFLIFRRILFGHCDIQQKTGCAVDSLFVSFSDVSEQALSALLARSSDIAATAHKTRMALESPSDSTCDCKVG